MKNKTFILIVILNLIILTGCTMNAQTRLERRLLRYLESKYDMEFVIVESTFNEYPIAYSVNATVAPADNLECEFRGYINSFGKIEDDYSITIFNEQLKDYYSVLCDYDFVSSYKIIVKGDMSNDNLTDLTFEEYLDSGRYFVTIIVYLFAGKTDDEYADEIFTVLSSIDEFDYTVSNFNVYLSDNIAIYANNLYNLNSEHGQGLAFYTHEYLMSEIYHTRQGSIFVNQVISGEYN